METIAIKHPADCNALVIDSNATARGILVSQLRDWGVGRVAQVARVRDARSRLEYARFDFVLCEQHFQADGESGQTLLDDLRRAALLPFSTVFFMVTGEAAYASVAEAAESALDGYLLKPFTPATLFERLRAAQARKAILAPIFAAIDAEDFEQAAALCLARFDARAPEWLYATRIGAELLLRTGRHDEARRLYQAVIEAKTLPWAKLGVARAQIELGQTARAVNTLDALLGEDGNFADAYDVMGAAQVELGQFDAALETYRRAAALTPSSIPRLQKHGMVAYYLGHREAAVQSLSRAAALGVESKLFDAQALVLLAFAALADGDRRTLERCQADFARVLERNADDARARRFAGVVDALRLIQQRQFAAAVGAVGALAAAIRAPDLDFEAACNLGGLLAVLAATSIDLDAGAAWVEALALRFGSTRSLGELLAAACQSHPPYADAVRQGYVQVNKLAERAMSQSLAGDAAGAVQSLLDAGDRTLNAKLADMAQQVLLRHQARIGADTGAGLQTQVDALRAACGRPQARATLGQDRHRAPGALSLRTSAAIAAPVAAPRPELPTALP